MLIRFVVSNFMSFKDETEFNMLKSKGNGSQNLKHHVVKAKSGVDVLKTAAIYGANAAGKSNLVKAIAFLQSIVTGDVDILIPQNLRFKLDKSYINKSTTFRIEYEYQNIHFDYAVEIFKGKIIEEWLYTIDSVLKDKENLLYSRKKNIVVFGDFFDNIKEVEFGYMFLKKQLKENETVLNCCYNLFDENKILNTIGDAFSKIRIVYPNSVNIDYTKSFFLGQKSADFADKILSISNTGIEQIVLRKININDFFKEDEEDFKNFLINKLENILDNISENQKTNALVFHHKMQNFSLVKEGHDYLVFTLCTKHKNSDVTFDFEEESDGTNRLFELVPALEELLFEDDITFIIDELERSLHPILAKQLLKLYSENSKTKSQLIFTTHESHLLDNDLLRRDEIWFTEKKLDGSTDFYPLSDFNPRGDKVLERGYLEGRYGGIPFLGDFSKLILEETVV